jgi:hypothetical protein
VTPRARTPRALAALVVASLAGNVVACGGGAPLLHPARTMTAGDVRLVTGVAANVAAGALSGDLRRAREIAAQDPQAPGASGSNPEYTKGALVAAAIAPGLSPVIAARVGVGSRFEGGLTYTGRAVRADLRRSFDDGPWSLSVGLGLSAALYGRQQGTTLANVDLGALRGYGADVPVLLGWESAGGLYKLYAGPRGGFEHVTIESVTSEPRDVVLGGAPIRLVADRFFGGGVVGFATGFRHVHVALELAAAYQVVSGTFNASEATVRGLTLTPASAVWTTF